MVLLRYGELALKGHNRHVFLRQLRRNVRAALKSEGLSGEVMSVGRRIYVYTDHVAEALEPLSRVFGLTSLSPATEIPRDMDDIITEALTMAHDAGVGPGVSFRVRARRTDKSFPVISPDISRLAGEAIFRATGGKIDLSDNAQVTVGVEVAQNSALVYGRVVPAPGGLPVGVEGRVVVLISSGIDSPVASWMMLKRGCGIIPLHFTQNEEDKQKALDHIATLQRHSNGWALRTTILDYAEVIGPTIRKLRELGEERWTCIFCKRQMILKACEVAAELGAHAVVLGDSLGQVASQTLPNMEVISHGMPKMILRPLIGLDKTEIIAIAQRIGTFDTTLRDEPGCAYLPARPLTRSTIERLQQIAQQLDEMETRS